jgi:HSP20 family protein
MAIVRWSPSTDLAGLHSAMDRLFSDMFGESFSQMSSDRPQQMERGNGGGRQLPTFHLPVNVSETEQGYRIEAPVPGFRPEDVEVTFADGVLSINAQRSEERSSEEGDYVRREVAYGNYRRQITLPGDVRADDIKASFDNGMLTIEVPRAPKPEPKRIQIRPGEQAKQLSGSQSQRR